MYLSLIFPSSFFFRLFCTISTICLWSKKQVSHTHAWMRHNFLFFSTIALQIVCIVPVGAAIPATIGTTRTNSLRETLN